MKIHATAIKDCYLIEPTIYEDSRGSFLESYNKKRFAAETGLEVDFVQDNMSVSSKNVIRGLHAQVGDMAQAKLVSTIQGEVIDVAVDMRADSPTYKEVVTVKLNGTRRRQLFVPRGCFHGFAVMSEQATFFYKCDNFYSKQHERGIHYADPELNIDWQVPQADAIVSEKDLELPMLKDLKL